MYRMLLLVMLATFFAHYVQVSAARRQAGKFDCYEIAASDLVDPKAPKFASFPARDRKFDPNIKLDLTSDPIARRFRTVIRQAMDYGPDFAGHYVVAHWGCGTSCFQFAVVDLQTGRVATPPFSDVSIDHLDGEGFLPHTDSDAYGLRYRQDSDLLVVLGAPDEKDDREGAFYFVVRNGRLQEVHRTLVKKKCP